MRASIISATNFKGATFEDELAPVTLFFGDNFLNKSARIEALQLALVGYVPGVAKKPSELFERLASGPSMRVGVVFDSETMSRVYTQKNGSVKYTGTDRFLPAMLVDSSEFLALSGPAQTRYLFKCATLSDQYTLEKVRLTLQAACKGIKLEENTAETEAEIAAVVDAIARFDEKETVQEWVIALAENFRLLKNASVEALERMTKTGQGLTQLQAQGTADVQQDAEQRWNAHLEKQNGANEKVASLSASLEAKQQSFAKLDCDIRSRQSENPELWRVEKEQAERHIVDWEKELSELTLEAPEALALDELPESAEEVENLVDWHKREHNLLCTEWSTIDSQRQALSEQLEEAKAAKCCPTCEQKISAAVKKKAVAVLTKKLAAIEKVASVEQLKVKEAEAALANAAAFSSKFKANLSRREALIASLEGARAYIAKCNSKLASVADIEKLSQERGKLTAELQELRVKLEAALREQASLKAKEANAQQDYKNLLAHRAAAKSKAEAAQKVKGLQAEVAVRKLTCQIVADFQAKLVDESVSPLVAKMNELCLPILPTPLGFREGELGSVNPVMKNWYSWRSFSGTQKALAYTALCIALAVQSPAKIALIDEVGRLYPSRKLALYYHLIKLCKEGKIDQAILIDAVDKAPLVPQTEYFKAIEIK